MSKFDKISGSIVLGLISFMVGFCVIWLLGILLDLDAKPGIIIGALAGIISSYIVLKKQLLHFFEIKTFYLIIIYALYMIGIIGLFMGVPIFNILPGIMAAYFVGRKMKYSSANRNDFKVAIKKVYIFSSICLGIFCMISAFIAIMDPFTAYNIEMMFDLDFELSNGILWGIIGCGGIGLIITQ